MLRLISSLLKFQEFVFENFYSKIPGSVMNNSMFSDCKSTIQNNRCVSEWRRQREGRKGGRGGREGGREEGREERKEEERRKLKMKMKCLPKAQ